MKGNPLTLVGSEVKVGDPGSRLSLPLDNNLCTGPTLVLQRESLWSLSSVPSLDTPVCDLETRRFNEEAGRLGARCRFFLTLSMDLPFAQRRWCGANGVTKIQTLSDHRDASFGTAYGS